MGLLDGPLRSVAANLVGKFGKPVTVKYVATGTYDPATGSTTGGSYISANVRVVVGDAAQLARGGFGETGEVRMDDLALTVAAQTFEAAFGAAAVPATDDEITIDGSVYMVVQVKPTWSGEQVALYELQVRR